MANDDSDAEFERRYPQKRQGIPTWAILLIVFGLVGFFGIFGLVAVGVAGFLFGAAAAPVGPPPVAMATAEPPPLAEQFTRAEFERAVTGKTPAEVKAILGEPPVSVEAERVDVQTWTYENRTTNPATGEVDGVAEVEFRGGKAVRVTYREGAALGPNPGGPAPPPGGPGSPPGK